MVRIIQAYLGSDPSQPMYATELMETARVGSGSLYPALARMEAKGWIVEEREDINPSEAGRPARRYFRMTGNGAREAHAALVKLSDSVRPPATSPAWQPDWRPAWRTVKANLQCLTGAFRPAAREA
ncbi:PadR family transcriptional regulator [Streptomyces sp. NPDC052415]|uniref:PadR family transcriptional regulator n=1 Tax=Streptomyces sp. NPDC052415 TaxID=3365690 RepID=UPI0037D26802